MEMGGGNMLSERKEHCASPREGLVADLDYDTHKFGGLRFFLELAVFLAVKLGIDSPKSGISFFGMCRKFLAKIEGLLHTMATNITRW
jgi:hypothetical protein